MPKYIIILSKKAQKALDKLSGIKTERTWDKSTLSDMTILLGGKDKLFPSTSK